MSQFKNLSRVALKFYPDIKGRIRTIEFGVEDKKRKFNSDVAKIYWDDGFISECPLDRLSLLTFVAQERYPWENPKKEKVKVGVFSVDDKPNPEVEAGKHD